MALGDYPRWGGWPLINLITMHNNDLIWFDWNNIEKDIRNFYFKCLTCGIRTSKPRKNYVVKHIGSDYPREKYQVDTTYLANYILNDSNI